jgi:hypothetical protein
LGSEVTVSPVSVQTLGAGSAGDGEVRSGIDTNLAGTATGTCRLKGVDVGLRRKGPGCDSGGAHFAVADSQSTNLRYKEYLRRVRLTSPSAGAPTLLFKSLFLLFRIEHEAAPVGRRNTILT